MTVRKISADLVITNGNVITVDRNDTIAEAIGVLNDKIRSNRKSCRCSWNDQS